jgi:hypothetical protein
MIFLEQIMRRWEAITARNSAMKMRLMRPMEIIYQGTRMREEGVLGTCDCIIAACGGSSTGNLVAQCFGSGFEKVSGSGSRRAKNNPE